MSAMSNLVIDIEEMLGRGESPQYIAKVLDIPISWVYEAMEKGNTEVFSPFETVNS